MPQLSKSYYFLQFEIHNKSKDKCGCVVLKKLDVQSVAPGYKRGRTEAPPLTLVVASRHQVRQLHMDHPQHHIKSLDLFSAKIPGFFVTKRSIPFFCGEALLGNYEGSCFKNWYSHELAKTSLFPLGSSSSFLLLFLWVFSRLA